MQTVARVEGLVNDCVSRGCLAVGKELSMKGKQIRVIKKNNPDSLEYNVGDILTVDSTWYGGVNVTSPSGVPLSLDREEYELLEEAEAVCVDMPSREEVCQESKQEPVHLQDYGMVNANALQYGLHDCCIRRMKLKDNQLTLKFRDGIAKCVGDDSIFVPGKVVFHDVDMDFCDIYVIGCFKNSGRFKGKKWRLHKFLKKHKKLNMIVLTITATGYDTMLAGCMWADGGGKEFFMEVFCTGGMEYVERSEKM